VDDGPGGLVGKHEPAEYAGMRRIVTTFCLCWLAWCGAPRSNTLPLAYGMTPAEAERALGTPLFHLSGRRDGSEILGATGSAGIPGFYPTEYAIALQFRKGRLTGWKKDWQLRHPF
jgi:hypothetical protein